MTANAVHRFVIEPASAAPDALAVTDAISGAEHSRADVAHGVRAAAGELERRGVVAGQRVMLCCADTAAFLWWFWGAMWVGAIPVPVSTMLTKSDYAFLLDDSRAVGLICSPQFTEAIAATQASQSTGERQFLRFVIDDSQHQFLNERASEAAPFAAVNDDVAFWLYTSGTTGFPKGAMHRHIDMGFCTDYYAKPVLDMGQDDVIYSVAKLFFAYGLGNAGYFPPGTGARVVLNSARPTPELIAQHVREHRPTLYFGVPTSYAQLLAEDLPDNTFASVRLAVSAGEPLPAEVHRRFGERFGVEILDGFGTTELCHVAITNRPGASIGGTSGTVLDGYRVSLRDSDGNEVPDGEPGALFVAGESVMAGYWNRTAQNRATLHGEFLATGDTYVREAGGVYRALGRTDDMLKVGGIWVSPTEVEATILELPSVVAAAVVGALDEDGLTKPKAFVVPAAAGEQTAAQTASLAAEVQSHVRERLAPYKYPRSVEVVDELPQTATGKIKRYLLREES